MSENHQLYERVSSNETDIPRQPPNYDDLESNLVDRTDNGIEQFEIEDEDFEQPRENDGFMVRASFMTKKFASNFSARVMHPVSKMIDPIYEGYSHFNLLYEKSILKLGNPLVVKRLLYVFFIMIVIFLITKYNISDGVNGVSGGAFSSGKFYDIDMLANSARDYIDAKVMKENLEYLSSMPHIAGSKGDLTLSKYVQSYMKENGIKMVDFEELQSFTNYPAFDKKKTYVKLADDSYEATLYEQDKKDMEYLSYNPNSLNTNDEYESFYIYGNFGTQEDLKNLRDHNVNLQDSILLIKYGGSIPDANKIQIAQQQGVKAVIFISSKFDIGTGDNKVTHDDVIQKENVGVSRFSPGDVLTPGWSSEDGYVTRLPWFKSQTTPKIPTIPISWKDASHFISQLGENGVKFDDGLYSGSKSSEAKHKIKLRITHDQRQTNQIWNIIGSIPGREQVEKGIIIGASRDSTCFGTMSTNTGTVILLELIKIFSALQRQYNWSPARSIYFASFDASEYNLAGSTEWIESRKETLKKEGYAYIDLSDAVAGDDLLIKSHPFLHSVIKDALKKVKSDKDDSKHRRDDNRISLYDLYTQQNKGSDDISNSLVDQKNYIPIINLANIPSLEIKFTGFNYPENSCYDNFDNFEKSGVDSSMSKHKQLVELLSKIALTLAEVPIIPYNFANMASKLVSYSDDLENYANAKINQYEKQVVPIMHFTTLRNSIDRLKTSGVRFEEWCKAWKQFVKESSDIEPSLLAMNRWKWNDNMIELNEKFIVKYVKPPRPGYVNVLFGVPFLAPDNGNEDYEWNTFPSVRDYLEVNDFGRAQHEIDQLANLIDSAAQQFLLL